MVRFDSWRAAGWGNRSGRSLATKPTYGGRATRQAVIRVKLEQASKAAMWMPTRRKIGEGRENREEPGVGERGNPNQTAPLQSTGVVKELAQCGEVWLQRKLPRPWMPLSNSTRSRSAIARCRFSRCQNLRLTKPYGVESTPGPQAPPHRPGRSAQQPD